MMWGEDHVVGYGHRVGFSVALASPFIWASLVRPDHEDKQSAYEADKSSCGWHIFGAPISLARAHPGAVPVYQLRP